MNNAVVYAVFSFFLSGGPQDNEFFEIPGSVSPPSPFLWIIICSFFFFEGSPLKVQSSQ